MQMRAKKTKWLLVCAVILLGVYLFLWKLILPAGLNRAIPFVEQTAAEYINGQLQMSTVEVSPDLAFTVKDVELRTTQGDLVAQIPALKLELNPFKLLGGSGAVGTITHITLERPRLLLVQNDQEEWNVAGLLKPSQSSSTDFKGKVAIRDGELSVQMPYGQWTMGVEGEVDPARNPVFGIQMALTKEDQTIQVTGTIDTDRHGQITMETGLLRLDDFRSLAAHLLPLTGLKGQVTDTSITWTGTEDGNHLSGKSTLGQVQATYTYNDIPLDLTASGDVAFEDLKLTASDLDATVNGQKAHLQGSVDLSDMDNPKAQRLTVQVRQLDLSALPVEVPAQGLVNAEITLNGDKDNLLGDGVLTSDALTVQGYTLTQLRLPLSIQGQRIEVNGASAEVGGRAVIHASYDWKEQSGIGSFEAQQIDLSSFVPRAGSLGLNGTLYAQGSYNDGTLKLETVSSDLALQWNELSLNQLAVDALITGSDVAVTRLSGYTAEGGALAGTGSYIGEALKADLYLTDIPITPLLRLAGQEGSGKLSTHLTASGTAANPSVFGAFSLKDAELMGLKIQEVHGALNWADQKLSFHKVEALMDQGTHVLDGSLDLKPEDPVVDATLTTTGIRLEPLAALAKAPIAITGNLTNTITVQGPLSNPKFHGHVHAYDGSVNKFLVDEVDGDYTYDGVVLNLQNFKLQALSCTAAFAGTVTRDGVLNLGLDARNLNLLRLPWFKDEVSLSGLVNFSGSITGRYTNPQFQGVLTSNSVFINNVEFTGLALSFQSQGGHVNSLQGTFQQKTGGDYSLKAYFDFDQRLIQWTADVERGNVRSLLQMGGLNLDIDGYLSGRIELNPKGRGTGMTIKGKVEDGKVRGVPFSAADFDIYTLHGNWQIRKLQATEAQGGILAAQGNVDLRKKTVDLELATNAASAKLLTVAFANNPPDVTGKMNIAAQVKGPLDNPKGNFSLELDGGSVNGVAFDSLYGMVTLRDQMFSLEQFLIQRDVYKVSAYGTFPMDLLRAPKDRKNPHAQMNLDVHLDNGNLAILPTLTKYVDWAEGPTSGNVAITGTLENYAVNGSIDMDNGTVKLKRINSTLDNMKFHAQFAGNTITLKEFSTTVGKNGSITASGSYQLHDTSGKPYQLTAVVKDVEPDSSLIRGKINGNLTVEQKNAMPFVTADFKLEEIYLGISSIPDLSGGGSNLGLDVTVDLGDDLHLYNASFFDIHARGKIHATGTTENPYMNGSSITVNKGSTLKYLGTPFRIGFGQLTWPMPGTFIPVLDLTAFTRLGQYNILAKASGPLSLDDLQIHLSSDPPQNEDTLKRFLTLKTDNADLTNADVQSLVDAGLQLTYLADVEDAIKDALGLDELRIYSGNLQTGIGFSLDAQRANETNLQDRREYNVLVSKYFGNKLKVGYTTRFDGEEYNTFAEYYIAKKVNLSFSVNQDQEHWYGVQYHTRF